MVYAALAQPPALGGSVKTFDDEKAQGHAGRHRQVLQTSSGVAVVADSWWHAHKARDALQIEWDAGPNAALNDAKIAQACASGARGGKVAWPASDGDARPPSRARRACFAPIYELPLLAHATLEPQNCTADVRADGADIYVPTQVQQIAQAAAAQGCRARRRKQVNVHTTFLGGGFGRRLEWTSFPRRSRRRRRSKKPVKAAVDARRRHDARRVSSACIRPGHRRLRRQGQAERAWRPAPDRGRRSLRACSPAVTEKMVDPFAVEAAR